LAVKTGEVERGELALAQQMEKHKLDSQLLEEKLNALQTALQGAEENSGALTGVQAELNDLKRQVSVMDEIESQLQSAKSELSSTTLQLGERTAEVTGLRDRLVDSDLGAQALKGQLNEHDNTVRDLPLFASIRLHLTVCASIRLHLTLFASIRLHLTLFASIRLHF